MRSYRVEFYDADGTFLGECRVRPGQNAQPPAQPRPPKGWRFDHWYPQVQFINSNVRAVAVHAPKEYLVTFLSEAGTVLKRQYVPHGHNAAPPSYNPGGKPVQWSKSTQNIQRAQIIWALIGEQIA